MVIDNIESAVGYLIGSFLANFIFVLILTRLVNYITVRIVENKKMAFVLSGVVVVMFNIIIANALTANKKMIGLLSFMVVISGILCLIYDLRRAETGRGIIEWLKVSSTKFDIQSNLPSSIMEAAAKGNPKALLKLGLMYKQGDEVSKDSAKAAECFQKAAEQGYVIAQFNLGLMYEQGDGVPRDSVKAVGWYQEAAISGLARAQYNLGWMYEKGEGVPKDSAKAIEWWQKAAEQGLEDAKLQFSSMDNGSTRKT